MCDEIPLAGGRVTQGVVKKGDFVIRPCCSNSVFVHEVLKWLETKDSTASPRFIGLTDDGREITSFLEGTSPGNLGDFSNIQLSEAGRVIMHLHTALADFPGCPDGFVVCHNDLSPCNFMFKNDLPYAVFDWDAATINDPVTDVAYAAWMWCDIGNDENPPVAVGKKVKVLLDGYGLEQSKRSTFIEKIHSQIKRTADSLFNDNMLDGYNWAKSCNLWLEQHGREVGAVI